MVSEYVKERLDEAGAILDQAEKMGNNPQAMPTLVACDGIMDNIKIFIHNDEAWNKINEKEKELNTMFTSMFKTETEKTKHKEEYYKFLEQQKIELKLLKWKCRQRLSFYDWLSQKYDI